MSATLDLNGGTTTLSADSANYYYQITDTSVGHNGTLIVEPGASIIFDDTAGAGFAATASDITITINGNSTSPCEIDSVSLDATNDWTMPALTANVTATRCTFRQYLYPFTSPGSWILNNCTFDYEIPDTVPFDFSVWFPHRISIENQQGYSDRGAPTYGALTVISCRVDNKFTNILGPDGNEIISDVSILMGGAQTVNPYDRVTLPDGTVRPVKVIKHAELTSGVTVLKVAYL